MLAILEQRAQFTKNAIAIEAPDQVLDYGALWDLVVACSTWLSSQKPRAIGLVLGDDIAWVAAHLACLHAQIPQVPLPAFFTPEQRLHALADAGVDLVLENASEATNAQWCSGTVALTAHTKVNPPVALPPGTALITYTSGSTGNPKGVCLSLDGMMSVAESLVAVLGVDVASRHLSVLPMAVLLEQVGGLYATLLTGGTYVFSGIQRDPWMLAKALNASRATSAILVPELLKLLLHSCAETGVRFPTLQFLAVGGARVSNDLLQQAAQLQLPVYQGYGLTESASVVAVNTPKLQRQGTVGKPLPHIKFHLAEDGEIILDHPAMLGYTGGQAWEGAYATGDLGAVDANGFLTIHGRKKNILITAYGRNISPEWPESLLMAQPTIAQAMVYGDAQAALSAVIVPAAASVDRAMIEAAMAQVNSQLPDYARIAAWRISAPFTVAHGTLTGTGRIRREAILKSLNEQKGCDHEFLRPACA